MNFTGTKSYSTILKYKKCSAHKYHLYVRMFHLYLRMCALASLIIYDIVLSLHLRMQHLYKNYDKSM